ncbi:MAG: ATP-binding protein [Lewinellaceae bacterium]|nr:ATP-binding protein [Lewinellaceae bacterium]
MNNKEPIRIAITGPESSGKTTLARTLAGHFQTVWVPEYARSYLEGLSRAYEFDDLEQIARGQLAWEKEYGQRAHRFLFCDTDLLVLKVWSEYKYRRCSPFILEALRDYPYDLFLLCAPDIPWEYDPLRENPEDRQELYEIYLGELERMGSSFVEVRGSLEERSSLIVEKLKS